MSQAAAMTAGRATGDKAKADAGAMRQDAAHSAEMHKEKAAAKSDAMKESADAKAEAAKGARPLSNW